jgi:hypothetical protein
MEGPVDARMAPGWLYGRDHPLLAQWLERVDLPHESALPDVEALEHARLKAEAIDGIARPVFARQDAGLLADGLHYESRIASRNVVATRERDVHDLFNAMVWLRHPRLKRALNARQVDDIGVVGTKRRTRGQYALTHFDEAGAIVWLADDGLLDAWDTHDWTRLFRDEAAAWGSRIALTVPGHALLEHVWNGHLLPTAKALVVRVSAQALATRCSGGALVPRWTAAEDMLAAAIRAARVLVDPQELRPLPLAGIPGWHPAQAIPAFHLETPCFRPLRPGRCYALPMRFPASA